MRNAALAGLVVALLGATRAHAQTEWDSLAIAGEIERLEKRWAAALVAQDTSFLQQLLAPEFALVVSAAPERPIGRAAWLATLPQYRTRALQIGGLTVRVLRGELAIASYVADLDATVGGTPRRGKYFITDVWRREGRTWRVLARYSSRPEEASGSTRALEKIASDSGDGR